MMTFLKLTLPGLLLFMSCLSRSAESISAETIINNSIRFHDPENNWNSFQGKFLFDSRFHFADSNQESIVVTVDVEKNYLKYHNLFRKVDLDFFSDTCILNSSNGSCDGYRWTKNFYTFIWGLPMKLKDPGISPISKYTVDTFNHKTCYNVAVHYEAENFQFYFDTTNYQMMGFSFSKNDKSSKGEIIYLDRLIQFQGIKFPKKKTYWVLPDTIFGGTNEALSIMEVD